MLVTASANQHLDGLLEELCLQLSLTESQHERATRAYETLGDWLSAPESALATHAPAVYPQGSIPLGTAVKPRRSDEFDADGVCVLSKGYASLSPQAAYDLVLERIRSHGAYRSKVSPQERCIRLDYEDRLHLDIIPAVPASADGRTRILIPSRDRLSWQPSDPQGFVEWFRTREFVQSTSFSIRADADPMPEWTHPAKKPPLQRIVQLFKRRRDVFFEGDEAARPKSILLTTLVARAYAGQPLATDGTSEVLASLTQSLKPGPPPHVGNPSNAEENLARHWREDQRSYAEFLRFRDDFAMKMRVLALQTGMDRIAGSLRELFDPDGSGAVDRAVTMLTDSLQRARVAGDVRMSRDGRSLVSKAAAAAISIPKNTFYGG